RDPEAAGGAVLFEISRDDVEGQIEVVLGAASGVVELIEELEVEPGTAGTGRRRRAIVREGHLEHSPQDGRVVFATEDDADELGTILGELNRNEISVRAQLAA